jgi:hypothetical protein
MAYRPNVAARFLKSRRQQQRILTRSAIARSSFHRGRGAVRSRIQRPAEVLEQRRAQLFGQIECVLVLIRRSPAEQSPVCRRAAPPDEL